ncbi:MAG: flagellar export protein FliJ [Proteobacteria bacterium]|nr:flagellar export protein FliJ [Pseudomonadota bacterium]
MKKFNFRLQRVLDFRHTLTKDKERELALKNHQLNEEEGKLNNILDEQNTTQIPERPMSMAEMSLTKKYIESLQIELVKQRLIVQEAKEAVEMAREVYLEKYKEEETLNRLKDKKISEHKDEKLRSDKKELSDMVVQRYRFSKN